jgi:hypothetical protein
MKVFSATRQSIGEPRKSVERRERTNDEQRTTNNEQRTTNNGPERRAPTLNQSCYSPIRKMRPKSIFPFRLRIMILEEAN